MAVSKKQQACVNNYVRRHYDKLLLTMPQGEKDVIKRLAADAGLSVNAFILRAVRACYPSDISEP